MDWQAAYQKVSEILAERTEERDQLRGEIRRLRALEKALRGITDLPLARPWHVLGSIVKEEGYRRWGEIIDAIADVLDTES